MKIAILASEGAPYCKSGGLGDVMEGLPAALSRIGGNEVLLILPYYKKIRENPAYEVEFLAQLDVPLGWRHQYAGILRLKNPRDNVQVWFVDNLYYFGGRDSSGYGHSDDGERFAFFSKACFMGLEAMDFIPQIIQCNDWQTAFVPILLKAQPRACFQNTRCVFTIHNIEYQGWAGSDFFYDVLALPEHFRACLDMNGAVNFMKGGIETCDLLTTVSETYAKELMYAYYAHGLQDVICSAAGKLTGITNGIDTRIFDPAFDEALPVCYNKDTFLQGKSSCKAALQKELGLPIRSDVPMLVMVTRLVGHKGLDLLCYIAPRLMAEDCQLVILGTGEGHYEQFFRELSRQHPQKAAAQITFDPALASRIYAGGDIYLMPSKSEPCGLSQMNAMRYGTVPVVHATGGLKDTVPPCDKEGKGGLGFTFESYNGDDFYGAIQNALHLYRNDPAAFEALQKADMSQDFSWDKPALCYMELFKK